MKSRTLRACLSAAGLLLTLSLATGAAQAAEQNRPLLLLASTNAASSNSVVVFRLTENNGPALSLVQTLPTGGVGGAGGNGGILQFKEDEGAVANFGSNTVTRLGRSFNSITVDGTINLAAGCVHPDSVALAHDHLYVVGSNCAESHHWPTGETDSAVVHLTDTSAGQIVAGETWAAVTLKSGSVLQLPLAEHGALTGASATVTLPANASTVPLGAAFWGDVLGFTPAHSVDSFALVNSSRVVSPVAGPTPSFPTNATCWVAKGRGNIWYTGNSPGNAISIFFSDGQGGVFYKSVPVPGVVTDLTTSRDGRWLAAIYSADGAGYIELFSVDNYGDLTPVATSEPTGATSFNGVAISQ